MLLRAFAKVNLDLRILDRRPDGYHEVRTILQTIDWCDEIRIEPAETFEFVVSGRSAEALVPDNLVVRAVRSFEQAMGFTVLARVELLKKIPIGAGLGGGSADAAATLLGLERFYDRSLPRSDLFGCLRALGSDVPFFAVGGRGAAIGHGDEVFPLEDRTNYWIVVVAPEVSISTREAYSWLTVSDRSNTIESFCAQFLPGNGGEAFRNDFERPIFRRYPALAHIKQGLLRAGASQAALSGSGAAMFGTFESEELAVKAASALAPHGVANAVRPLPRAEYLRRMFE
jgi:4-diphosphocytidyl-2-C-methyl-D-erythritol kinase